MQIVERKTEFTTPWFKLISKRLASEPAPFYSLEVLDYVCVLAVTSANEIILVRQYRPAVEQYTLELPSGHVEKNESPEESGRRELAEECGFDAATLEPLGPLFSDTGRIGNRLWCFLAPAATPMQNFVPEPGVERVLVPAAKISEMILNGEFIFSMHMAPLLLAMIKRGTPLFS